MEITGGDIGLVLWHLRSHGEGTLDSIASRLPEYMTSDRTAAVLREAEARGLVRELAGFWSLTEAGQTYVDE